MSEANADSASPGQEQVTAPADSAVDGQEQGDQSRLNGLMSLAQKRTAERDAALAEIEALKAQLAEHSMVGADEGVSQIDLMNGKPDAPEQDVDPMEQPEPPVIRVGVNPARPDYQRQPTAAPGKTNPGAEFLRDKADIAAMKAQLSGMARANGWGSNLDN